MKNKKAIFIPTLVLVTIVVLTVLAMTVERTNIKKEELQIGQPAVIALKLYDEGEKALFYIGQSAELAKDLAELNLGKNGGYVEDTTCKKTPPSLIEKSYVVWGSCPKFDIDENFKAQFNIDFKKYLQIYTSTYGQIEIPMHFFEKILTSIEEVEEQINWADIYSDNIRNSEISNIKKEEDFLIGQFDEITYLGQSVVEFNPIYYTIKPVFKTEWPDIILYDNLYATYISCIAQQNKEQACKDVFESEFGAIVTKEGNYLKIKIKGPPEIRFAIQLI